jgi:hypothetical protein
VRRYVGEERLGRDPAGREGAGRDAPVGDHTSLLPAPPRRAVAAVGASAPIHPNDDGLPAAVFRRAALVRATVRYRPAGVRTTLTRLPGHVRSVSRRSCRGYVEQEACPSAAEGRRPGGGLRRGGTATGAGCLPQSPSGQAPGELPDAKGEVVASRESTVCSDATEDRPLGTTAHLASGNSTDHRRPGNLRL